MSLNILFKKTLEILTILWKVRDAADELQTSKPLTGAGYFNVEKTTLTAMVSTTATYAVILYQMA